MTQKNPRLPARTPAVPLPVPFDRASAEADGTNIIVLNPAPKRWLHVTFALPAGADPARAGLGAAWFVTRLRAIDKRLRLTLARERCATTTDGLLLAFAPLRGGLLDDEWLDGVRPAVAEAAGALDGAELKAVEVVVEAGA